MIQYHIIYFIAQIVSTLDIPLYSCIPLTYLHHYIFILFCFYLFVCLVLLYFQSLQDIQASSYIFPSPFLVCHFAKDSQFLYQKPRNQDLGLLFTASGTCHLLQVLLSDRARNIYLCTIHISSHISICNQFYLYKLNVNSY